MASLRAELPGKEHRYVPFVWHRRTATGPIRRQRDIVRRGR